MAVISDFATLRSEVTNWLSRTGDSDFERRFSLLVQLVEGEINDLIRLGNMEVEQAFTILGNDDRVQMPADFGGVRGQPYLTGLAGQIGLDVMPLSEVLREGRFRSGSGARVYAMHGRDMVIRPISTTDQTVNVRYYKRLAPLEDGPNVLITSAPDVYLNGTLSRGFEYLGRESDGDEADAIFRALLDDVMDSDAFQRWGTSPMASRPQFTPSDRGMIRVVQR